MPRLQQMNHRLPVTYFFAPASPSAYTRHRSRPIQLTKTSRQQESPDQPLKFGLPLRLDQLHLNALAYQSHRLFLCRCLEYQFLQHDW